MILFERQTSDEIPRRGIRSYHGYICMCRCAGYSLRGGRLKGKGKGVLVARETHWAGARALPFRAPLAFLSRLKPFTCHVGYEGYGFEAVYSGHGLLARYI